MGILTYLNTVTSLALLSLPTKAAWVVAYAWRPLLNGGLNKRKASGNPAPPDHRPCCMCNGQGGAPLALSAIDQAYALCAQLFGLPVVCCLLLVVCCWLLVVGCLQEAAMKRQFQWQDK